MSDILDSKGNPTTVLCVTPTGEEILCDSTERFEQVFIAYPSCQIWFGGVNDEQRPE